MIMPFEASVPRCVYCGSEELRLTRDHVPPKCLFPRPRPQLITVPACHLCNDSFKRDDQYFRIAVIAEAVHRNDQATELWRDRVAPRMGAGLQRTLLRTLQRTELRTPAGLVVGRGAAIPFDPGRINRVVKRIVQGLLWHHYQSRPTDAHFDIYFNPDLNLLPLAELLSATNLNSIGDNVFRYRHGTVNGDPDSSVWGLQFYGHTHFFIVVLSNSLAQEFSSETQAPPLLTETSTEQASLDCVE
jgi:hypothetical protein